MLMNETATILFTALEDGSASYAKTIASKIRKTVPIDAWTPEQHQALETILREQLEQFTWFTLGRFDNVGCSLPDGVLGYSLLARPYIDAEEDEIEALPSIDIRHDGEDYADMWLDFLHTESEDSVP